MHCLTFRLAKPGHMKKVRNNKKNLSLRNMKVHFRTIDYQEKPHILKIVEKIDKKLF